MLRRTLSATAVLVTVLSTAAVAQTPVPAVATATRAMGMDTLTSITYSGTARNGAFGQSKSIGEPMGPVNLTQVTAYTRTINFAPPATPATLVSRATGTTMPPTVPGAPAPTPGVLNQNITGTQASSTWTQALNIWTTPWGFLKGAAAAAPNTVTLRQEAGQQVIAYSPATLKSPSGQSYVVTGYLNAQNLVTKVETKVENAVVGDLPVVFEYSNYQAMNGVQVPTRIAQRQAGLLTFEANITAATPNPQNLAQLLTPPAPAAPAAGAAPPPAAPAAPAAAEAQMLGPGTFKITGNYTSLAVDMGDHILVVESGASDARGMEVMAAAKRAIPNKPVRFVVNSHPHFDHASGLAAAVAEGATILTHRNNEPVLEQLLAGPRTLPGDSLSKVATRRTNVVEAVADRDVRRGTNGKVVELHHVANEHSDGMFAVYLPAEKILWTADVSAVNPSPAQLGILKSVVGAINRLNLDYSSWLQAHPPNPDRAITKADVTAAASAN